jgi:hypothetical protein
MSQRKALLVALYLAAHARFATGVQILNSQPNSASISRTLSEPLVGNLSLRLLFFSEDPYKPKLIAYFTYKVPGSYHLCVASPSVLHRASAITVEHPDSEMVRGPGS